MTKDDNNALCELNRVWKWQGDWMTCKYCERSLIASRDGEELNHKDGCKNRSHQHPWQKMREILNHD